MESKLYAIGLELEQKQKCEGNLRTKKINSIWNGNGMEKEWKWNGSFIRKKVDTRWNGNGMDMEWKWNGKNMVIHHQKNGVWKWNGMEMEMEMELTIMPMESFHGIFLSFL